MKSIVLVALALVAAAVAVPVEVEPIKTLRYVNNQSPEGDYQFGFDTENGISRDEEGKAVEVLDEENKPHVVVVVRGTYSVPGADGKPEVVSYVADAQGYRAEGPSIPKASRR